MPGSDIGSVRSCRAGRRTYDAKSDFAILAYNPRMRGVSTFWSSDSESKQTFGSIGYLSDLLDSHVPSDRSVSDFHPGTTTGLYGSVLVLV